MVTIKAYTDLSQSKKLAKILPLESADMHYVLIDTEEDKYGAGLGKYNGILPHYPCWSLAALLSQLPKYNLDEDDDGKGNMMHCCSMWWTKKGDFETSADNPIDACYEMIIKLHELNLL